MIYPRIVITVKITDIIVKISTVGQRKNIFDRFIVTGFGTYKIEGALISPKLPVS